MQSTSEGSYKAFASIDQECKSFVFYYTERGFTRPVEPLQEDVETNAGKQMALHRVKERDSSLFQDRYLLKGV